MERVRRVLGNGGRSSELTSLRAQIDELRAELDRENSYRPRTLWERGMRDFLGTFSFVKLDVPDWHIMPPEEAAPLAQELGWRAILRGRVDAIGASSTDSWFRVRLNGVSLLLPRYTLMVMRHCLTANVDRELGLLVEMAHWEWMKALFGDNTLFLDIGAAAGTMTVPYALSFPDGLRIVAFEPSRRARDFLERTLTRNGAKNVTVLPFALSDASGDLSFMELPEDFLRGSRRSCPKPRGYNCLPRSCTQTLFVTTYRYARSMRFRSNYALEMLIQSS